MFQNDRDDDHFRLNFKKKSSINSAIHHKNQQLIIY